VIAMLSKKAQHKSFWTKHRSIYAAEALRAKDGILTPQSQQIAMQPIDFSMQLTFGEIQLRALEGRRVRRIRQATLHSRGRDATKLGEELSPALAHQRCQFSLVVSEVEKGTGGSKLLPLKKHGRSRTKQY